MYTSTQYISSVCLICKESQRAIHNNPAGLEVLSSASPAGLDTRDSHGEITDKTRQFLGGSFAVSAMLFAIERVSREGIILRDKGSRARVSFAITQRKLGTPLICEENPPEDMISAMTAYVRRIASTPCGLKSNVGTIAWVGTSLCSERSSPALRNR
jgi:hypothetical protein